MSLFRSSLHLRAYSRRSSFKVVGLGAVQRSFHSSSRLQHGDHSHSHLTLSKDLDAKEANKITWLGLGVNIGLASTKGAVAYIAGSAALMADAAHSASDVVSDGVALLALKISGRRPDAAYPYGYGRIDTLGTLAVAALLVGGGIEVGREGAISLVDVLSSSPATFDASMGPLALGMALVSIVAKEALFRATIHVGKKARSPVVVANAWHHRSDAFSSIVAAVGVGGAMNGMTYLDGLAGVLVAGFIVKAGINVGWQAIKELADARVNEVVITAAQKVAKDLVEAGTIKGIGEVRCRQLGTYCLVDVVVLVDPSLNVADAHSRGNAVRTNLMKESLEVNDVFVHVCPEDGSTH